jgi:hypothetical protein
VLDQIRTPAALEMYRNLAARQAEGAKIEYTGAVPHFDPVSRQLVPATGTAK